MLRGVTSEITERIVELKRSARELRHKYGSLEDLQHRIQQEGVSPDDHTLYTDLLEWRSIQQEMAELMTMLETF